ncbi:heme biosynthesis HemY N-terminal domain-containing protein [Pseudoalteromonas mariniglutinosa]|uniref:heme biosynthesis HemY N-terminal domain-containing protein n=1 Tax=Pseudoalteromonas mariniglutinosa TaxID=206042 RepID=UPI00384B9D8A
MIRLILVILAVAALLAISPTLIGDVGYVLISFNKTTYEGSIVAFGLVMMLTALLLYLSYKLVRYLWSLYSNTRHRFFARSEERKQAAIEQSVWSLLNNDMAQLQLALENNSVAESWYDVRFALLAKAALSQNKQTDAVAYLDKISPSNQLKAAHLWLASGDCSTISGELKRLAEGKKATALELKLYAQVLVQQQKWPALQDFMPRLVRKKVLSDGEWQQLFQRYFADQASNELSICYEQLSKHVKNYAETPYLQAMARTGQLNKIELTLLKMLKKPEQHKAIADILRNSAPGDALKLQASLQDILQKDSHNIDLLLALACLANAHGEYDLAARVFDKALNAENRADYLHQAALSYSKSAQPEKALVLYQ